VEARDRAGRFFRLDECVDTLRRPDLEQAADELLSRLLAHTGRRLDDDVALLLFEATPSASVRGVDPVAGQGSLERNAVAAAAR